MLFPRLLLLAILAFSVAGCGTTGAVYAEKSTERDRADRAEKESRTSRLERKIRQQDVVEFAGHGPVIFFGIEIGRGPLTEEEEEENEKDKGG